MRDICLISLDAGHLMKMRDCPSECGTVDTYEYLVAVRRSCREKRGVLTH